jgi:hypothetical protein
MENKHWDWIENFLASWIHCEIYTSPTRSEIFMYGEREFRKNDSRTFQDGSFLGRRDGTMKE